LGGGNPSITFFVPFPNDYTIKMGLIYVGGVSTPKGSIYLGNRFVLGVQSHNRKSPLMKTKGKRKTIFFS